MGHPFLHDAVEMPLVQRDHKVQTLSPQSPDDPFADRIGHGRPYWRFDHVQPHVTYGLVNVFGEDDIPVMDENAVRVVSRNGFAELLPGPLRRGMGCDIDVEEPPAGMLNHHKDIENAECRRDCHAEVTRDNALSLITNKCGPALRLTAFAWTADAVTRHVFAHGAWRNPQAEFAQEFVGDAFLPPGGILQGHATDDGLQVPGQGKSPRCRLPP